MKFIEKPSKIAKHWQKSINQSIKKTKVTSKLVSQSINSSKKEIVSLRQIELTLMQKIR